MFTPLIDRFNTDNISESMEHTKDKDFWFGAKCRCCGNVNEYFYIYRVTMPYDNYLMQMKELAAAPLVNRCERCKGLAVQDICLIAEK